MTTAIVCALKSFRKMRARRNAGDIAAMQPLIGGVFFVLMPSIGTSREIAVLRPYVAGARALMLTYVAIFSLSLSLSLFGVDLNIDV